MAPSEITVQTNNSSAEVNSQASVQVNGQANGQSDGQISNQANGQANGHAQNQQGQDTTVVKLERRVGLLDAISMNVGLIIGSGIFISTKGVLRHSKSYGEALIIWGLSGLMSLIGALCYAELGTMIPKSGGDYTYINEIYGPLPAFLYLWMALFILMPTGNAITALTFSQYILQAIWEDCETPNSAVRLLAAVVICFLTAVNCWNVNVATKVQSLFAGTKIIALVIVIISGIYWLSIGHTEHFQNPFAFSNLEPGDIALSMFNGMFSYSGYNFLTFITEEMKQPNKTLPRAIYISMPIVTMIYVLTNVAYFVVLTSDEILRSNAVAVTFGNKMLGTFSWIMPVSVAISTFGSLNGAIFTSARLFFVGARDGNLPGAISLINVKTLTPMPSIIFTCILSLILLVVNDIYSLINYTTFSEAVFTTVSVSGVLWLRYKKPDAKRPIKISIILPILSFLTCIFLCITPLTVSAWEVAIAAVIILAGIPVYYLCIAWEKKPKFLSKVSESIYVFSSRLLMCVPEDKED